MSQTSDKPSAHRGQKIMIEKSFSGARWVMPDITLEDVEKVMQHYDVPEIIARLLCSRDIPFKEIGRFLNPTLKSDFPDPFSLNDMKAVSTYLASAIVDRKNIAVFGDFDVDGATSSAILYRFLKHCGQEVSIYIPDRLTEGYGPNIKALHSLKEKGTDIVVLLDCGTTSFNTVKEAREVGLEIVIVDHHEAEQSLPEANFVINPKRKDDESSLGMLAACGVTFLLCVAVNSALRERGFFKDKGLDEAPLKDFLDLVALGTVCDMVPLIGANRLFVRYGFSQMMQTNNMGLKALIDTAGLKGPITPYHAGFILGPRINAGSRVHQSDLGARLLSTGDIGEARDIAWTLNDCNDKRKAIQSEMEHQAIKQVEDKVLNEAPVIVVDHHDWHSGLSGLVAGRLREKYGKPACVITYVKSGEGHIEGRGSGRSVPGVHLANAFIDARTEGLLVKGGGHAMAGGFTVLPDKISDFKMFLNRHIQKQAESTDFTIENIVDGLLSVWGARPDFVRRIQENIGPFGQEHPEPFFLFSNVRLHAADILGNSHIRLLISDWEGGMRMKAMAFRAVGTPMGDAFLKEGRRAYHLAGYLKIDNWSGQDKVELHIQDAAFAFEESVRDVEDVLAEA